MNADCNKQVATSQWQSVAVTPPLPGRAGPHTHVGPVFEATIALLHQAHTSPPPYNLTLLPRTVTHPSNHPRVPTQWASEGDVGRLTIYS